MTVAWLLLLLLYCLARTTASRLQPPTPTPLAEFPTPTPDYDDDDDYVPGPHELDEAFEYWLPEKIFLLKRIEPPVETIMVPLHFPVRNNDSSTSPPDKMMPMMDGKVTVVIPQCNRSVYMVTHFLNDDEQLDLFRTVSLNLKEDGLHVTVSNWKTKYWGMGVHVRCYDLDVPNPLMPSTWDPRYTYIFAIRPNFGGLDWFWDDRQGYTAHIRQDYQKTVLVEEHEPFVVIPMFNVSEFGPYKQPLPDSPIFASRHSMVTATFKPCYSSRVTIEDYTNPKRFGKYIKWQESEDTTVMFWPDINRASVAFYYLDCMSKPNASDYDYRYTVIRPMFRDSNIGSFVNEDLTSPTKYPMFTYNNWVFAYLWQLGKPYLRSLYRGQNLTFSWPAPAGFNSANFSMLSDLDHQWHSIKNGTYIKGQFLRSSLTYDGQHVYGRLANLSEINFGTYAANLTFHNGSHFASRIYLFFIRPNITHRDYDELKGNISAYVAPRHANPLLDGGFKGPIFLAQNRGSLAKKKTLTTPRPKPRTTTTTAPPPTLPPTPCSAPNVTSPPAEVPFLGRLQEEDTMVGHGPDALAAQLSLAVIACLAAIGVLLALAVVGFVAYRVRRPGPTPAPPSRNPIYIPTTAPFYASAEEMFPEAETVGLTQ